MRGTHEMKRSSSERNLWMVALSWTLVALLAVPSPLIPQSNPVAPPLQLPGQTATRLPDGRILLIGGENTSGISDTVSVWDPSTNTTTPTSNTLRYGRAWHTATILPDGLILILGGHGRNKQLVEVAEVYNPNTNAFTALSIPGLTPRARHTATLLSDGQVLIAGGTSTNGEPVHNAEVWNSVEPGTGAAIASDIQRRNHTATLLPDGRVLIWGGSDTGGRTLSNGELFDPLTNRFTPRSDLSDSTIRALRGCPGLGRLNSARPDCRCRCGEHSRHSIFETAPD